MVEIQPSDLGDNDGEEQPQQTDVGQMAKRVWERVQENPRLQQLAVQVAEKNGVDITPLLEQQQQRADGGQPAPAQPAQQPEAEAEAAAGGAVSASEMLGFMEEIADLHPKGWQVTLSDLYAIGEENPEILEEALKERIE